MSSFPRKPSIAQEFPTVYTTQELRSAPVQIRRSAVKVGHGRYILAPHADLQPWEYEAEIYRGQLKAIADRKSTAYAFSHATAAFLHGFTAPLRTIDITQPVRDRPGKHSRIRYIKSQIPPEQICMIAGLPVTTIERTVIDCLLRLPLLDALIIADQALRKQAYMNRFDMELVYRQEHARTGFAQNLQHQQSGVVRARAILDFASGLSESPRETELRLLCAQLGIPAHHIQWRFAVEGREYYTDLGWQINGKLIAAEFDGTAKYLSDPHSIRAEKAREIALNSVGLQLVRFQAGDLQPASLPARTLLRAIQAAGGAPAQPRRYPQLMPFTQIAA